ncbi:MAG: radical SAM family heme chaperone HemW [Spirochaetes bacterium]|nr:radical SAM family heme chaperone HemW [Spirochaetota bacterium]
MNKPQAVSYQTQAPSLYIHVPFCISRCTYCDYCTASVNSLPDQQKYLNSLHQELAFITDFSHIDHFDTVYIGGGSPSCLPPELLQQLLSAVQPFVAAGTEVSMELNPMDCTPHLLQTIQNSCINRLSIGVQSLDDKVRKIMQRRGSAAAVIQVVSELLVAWNGSVSVDLMYGLPTQNQHSLLHSLQTVLQWPIQHLSLYELILEPASPLAARIGQGSLRLPSDEENDSTWHQALQTLAASGMQRYEVSNWALPGQECRHNQHYWQMHTWYGLGPSAVGNSSAADGSYIRHYNTSDTAAYCLDPLACAYSQKVSGKDALFEYIMMALRTSSGLLWTDLQTRHPELPPKLLQRLLSSWPDHLTMDSRGLRATSSGLDLLNGPLQQLLTLLDGI